MRAATLLVLAATVTGLAVPEILWKGLRYRGVAECNTVLHRVQSGVMPMTTDDRQKLKNYAAAGDETLAKLSDEEVLSAFEIRDREELEEICARHGRQMNLAWGDVSLETKCVNADGTVLEYPKVFRIEGSPDFPTDFLARLHVLRRKSDNACGEEFVKVLNGAVTWFMVVEQEVAKVEVPKGWQIFYHGFVEHGALIDSVADFVTCTQIIGPPEWELVPTGRENPLLEDAKKSRLEGAK
mmetsp:Transcript_10677/g.32920  ORF Transcript_10677/g.32920 Transcript_10677/m.32920 type:complete len:240 (+) Transcript_10677:154-873(+)